jgi:exodeoxyribonuclease VII small subunit
MGKKKKAKKAESFENLLGRVEELVRDLETGNPGIEEALGKYEEAMKALGSCRDILARAEKRIEMLVRSAEGGTEVREFSGENAGEPAPARKKKAAARKKKAGPLRESEGELLF